MNQTQARQRLKELNDEALQFERLENRRDLFSHELKLLSAVYSEINAIEGTLERLDMMDTYPTNQEPICG